MRTVDRSKRRSDRGAYGDDLGSRFLLDSAPCVTVRTLRKSQLAVTEITMDSPVRRTLPIPPEDAFLVHLMTRDCITHDIHVDNKSVAPDPFPKGITALYDLTRDPIAEMHSPAGCLSFYLPRAALAEMAEDLGVRRVLNLEFRHGRAYDDPVMRSLSQALIPAFARPDQVNNLFVDHIGLAFRAHIAQTYGGMQSMNPRARGGLASWQQRRARDLIANDLAGEVPLSKLAQECGLSVSHFTRAFRQSLGTAPHQWLLAQRVERAKDLLLKLDTPLTTIAVDCGFADQSHFTRVFTKAVGLTPGRWRREHASGIVHDQD